MMQIIQDFCQWVENLGGEEKSEITVDTMQQLFEIGFDAPAARSLCVRFEELPVVTETAARARNLPEVSVSTKKAPRQGYQPFPDLAQHVITSPQSYKLRHFVKIT
jgi:hypothetical protein